MFGLTMTILSFPTKRNKYQAKRFSTGRNSEIGYKAGLIANFQKNKLLILLHGI
jgi:hypothetical protein